MNVPLFFARMPLKKTSELQKKIGQMFSKPTVFPKKVSTCQQELKVITN